LLRRTAVKLRKESMCMANGLGGGSSVLLTGLSQMGSRSLMLAPPERPSGLCRRALSRPT
jgi:hypothetical protein